MSSISRRTILGATAGAGLSFTLDTGASLLGLEHISAIAAEAGTGGEVIIGIGVDPTSFDSRNSQVTEGDVIAHSITSETLFRSDEGKVIPQLAESWSYPDPTTMLIKIRPGIKFTNGEPLDSAAVKYTLDCLRDPSFANIAPERRGWFKSLTSIETPDPLTLVLKMQEPNHAILSYLTLEGIVAPKAAAEAGAKFGLKPIGTGPFIVDSYTPGSQIVLVPNKDFRDGPPTPSKVTIRFIPEAATRVAALEAGEVHAIENVDPTVAARLKASPKFDILSVPSVRVVFMAFMTDRPPFNNLKLRQALMHAMDRKSIVSELLNGNGEVAQSVYAPGVGYYKPQTAYAYDPDLAKKLIAESGFDTSQTLKFAYPTGRTVNDRAIGEATVGMLQNIGLKVVPDAPEWGTFLNNYQVRRIYDMVIASMGPANLDPDYALSPWFRSDQSFVKYSNPKADELLKAGSRAVDPAELDKIYGEAQTLLWNDLGYAPMYVVPQLWVKSKRLTGFNLRRDAYWLYDKAAVTPA